MKRIYKIILAVLLPSIPVFMYYIYQKIKNKVVTPTNQKSTVSSQQKTQSTKGMIKETNNPMNLRPMTKGLYQGQKGVYNSTVGNFCIFIDYLHSYRAAIKLLNTYYTKYGLNTIEGLINRYAPASENSTNSYVDFVSKQSGFDKNELLTFDNDTIFKIIQPMARMESNTNLDKHTFDSAWSLAGFKS